MSARPIIAPAAVELVRLNARLAPATRKATTSAETLRSEEDTTARIIQTVNASATEALRTTVYATVADAVRAAVTEASASVDSRLTNNETRLANMGTTVNNTLSTADPRRPQVMLPLIHHGQHRLDHMAVELQGLPQEERPPAATRTETRLPNNQTPPDVIALQETTSPASLPGYIAFQQFTDGHNQETPSTGTLVHKSLTAKQHDLEFPDIPHTVVEILPRKRSHQ
ncbi:hypothetical protein HPB52_016723 [Rhipicephalus sanguineus]|uniref:Uncharacterized protein n=1 Tax=Rhipicephalus sanguineus TaxID=34632 RepID=A0A9D4PDB5_RHISA|nr:hypothetical protein HPB52_016723 [Rhipicephalus sanguineus]